MRQVIFYQQFILIALGMFLFTFKSNAQIEDFQVGNTNRRMLVYAPSDLQPNSPLLLSMHGLNQDINYQQNQSRWEAVAKEHGFVVVYPGGINNSWDISGTRDTDFILAIIDEMSKRYDIDRDRVYLSGFSMGGMMTYHAATRIADKIAAFAPVSGYLMGGPRTNSSRPIPLIHVHGTTDDVVPYSGVQRCMDAWIARNNCPTTAVVTTPYPVSKPNSNATKYYWGPGTDSVEIVLLSLPGKGHWHSNEDNGVHTSQEIWNFCKNFSLGFGVPKLTYASVNDADPKQVKLRFNLPIKGIESFDGFTVKIDDQEAVIDNIVLADSVHLAIMLVDDVLNSNEIHVSYTKGNVVSVYDKDLANFADIYVENLLAGAAPRIVEIKVTDNDGPLLIRFNKEMQLPIDLSSLELKAEFDGELIIPITECTYYNDELTTLALSLGEQVFADYGLTLTYTGDNVMSVDEALLRNFADLNVENNSKGLPVQVVKGQLEDNAFTIALEFSKSMKFADSQLNQLSVMVNNKKATVKEVFTVRNVIRLVLSGNVYFGDSIKVSYTPGNITASDKGDLDTFTDLNIENILDEPIWYIVPGKVEAEDYTLQFGTDTETTGDTGCGRNVGWTDAGDWLVYAIENNTDETEFVISFRVAAQEASRRFDFYINDVRKGQMTVPNTGGWQRWQSVERKISLEKGKQYLKLLAVTGGFNINYFEIYKEPVGIGSLSSGDVSVYPNPVTNELIIQSHDFKHQKIEVFDAMGALVLSRATKGEGSLKIEIDLPEGLYFLKMGNETRSLVKKIQVIRN